ncbi:S-Ena type endospore appendage [Bacillus sp. 2205SS5-2]|uniref:S-Ena type endospore appendage n=1 Tax=Bacillus sp. 2205SS5-2 TaxID=3109031 RepID=UPI003007294E
MSCTCNSKTDCCFGCCSDDFVQDQSNCCNFTLRDGVIQEVYVAEEVDVTTSGTISINGGLNNGGVAEYIVQFRTNGVVNREIIVFGESCVVFTATRFNNIAITAPGGQVDQQAKGEICVSPRYRLS